MLLLYHLLREQIVKNPTTTTVNNEESPLTSLRLERSNQGYGKKITPQILEEKTKKMKKNFCNFFPLPQDEERKKKGKKKCSILRQKTIQSFTRITSNARLYRTTKILFVYHKKLTKRSWKCPKIRSHLLLKAWGKLSQIAVYAGLTVTGGIGEVDRHISIQYVLNIPTKCVLLCLWYHVCSMHI